MDEKVTLSRPVEPVQVAVIGTGDGSRLASGIEAVTPGTHEPNIVVTVITPVLAIVIRFVNGYLTAFVGLMGAAQTDAGSKLLHTGDFLSMVAVCASLSLAGPSIDLVKNLITIFGRLERRYPLLTGSV
jgi:hypothetical protein